MSAVGISVPPEGVRQLARYGALLEKWNAKIALTTVTEPRAFAERHVLDSYLVTLDPMPGETLLDAGTGAGLPGIVVATLRPDVQVTMVERVSKKIAFVRAAIDLLALDNARVLRQDLTAVPAGSFDRAVSRALMSPTEWLSAARASVRPGGAIGVMVARREELPADPTLQLEAVRELVLPSDRAGRIAAWFRT